MHQDIVVSDLTDCLQGNNQWSNAQWLWHHVPASWISETVCGCWRAVTDECVPLRKDFLGWSVQRSTLFTARRTAAIWDKKKKAGCWSSVTQLLDVNTCTCRLRHPHNEEYGTNWLRMSTQCYRKSSRDLIAAPTLFVRHTSCMSYRPLCIFSSPWIPVLH